MGRKAGYVYDPVDGFRYEKDLYYQLFEPVVVETYDEKEVLDYPFYQEVITKSDAISLEKYNLTLILQYLEILEQESPTFNHSLLLEEIRNYRNMHHLQEKVPAPIMRKYREYMAQNSE